MDHTHAGDLSPTEAWELLVRDPGAMLVDVRTTAEWAFVGVPDVRALGRELHRIEWLRWPDMAPNADFVEQLRSVGADQASAVVLICRSGHRSAAAAAAATRAGISPAYNVAQGFEGDLDGSGHRGGSGWRASGLPWRQS